MLQDFHAKCSVNKHVYARRSFGHLRAYERVGECVRVSVCPCVHVRGAYTRICVRECANDCLMLAPVCIASSKAKKHRLVLETSATWLIVCDAVASIVMFANPGMQR